MAVTFRGLTSCSTFTLYAVALAGSAHAATPAAPDDIIVTAPRQDRTARAEQKAAPNIVSIQSAESIAKYPDVNAAEALSRVPGVALSIDTGEGRFVNIRGLDGNLNGSTFGGVVLLNTQANGTYFNAAGRAVEFDTVPVGSIDRIVVTKTGLPDHEAEGLGGSVELTPRTAIGRDKPFIEVTLGGGYELGRKTGLIRDEIVVGGGFGPHNDAGHHMFSAVLTQFLFNDKRGFDDIEAAYINDQPATPDKAFDALELRRYQYRRQRHGYSAEFDFTPDATTRFYLRGNLAGYTENVHRNRFEIDGLADGVIVPSATPNGFVVTNASTVKTLRDERETHRNLVLQLGGEKRFAGGIKLDAFVALSRATYRKYYDYNSTFAGPTGLTVAYDNSTDPNHPKVTFLGSPNPLDLANYTLDGISNATERDRDQEYSYAANLTVPVGLMDQGEIKFGGKLRYRHKTVAPQNFTFGYTGAALPIGGFLTGGPVNNFYGYLPVGPDLDGAALSGYLIANQAVFSQNTARDLRRNASGFFNDHEDITAGFVQYSGTSGPLGMLAGVRVEHTRSNFGGIARTTAGGVDTYAPATTRHSYTNVFPTLQLKYQLTPALVGRATYSTGIARPGFYQTILSSSVDIANNIVTTGNPNLKPVTGNNFDASLEYYLSDSGIISLGAFDKEFRNYVVARTRTGNFENLVAARINSFENVRKAHARGFEAAFVDRLRGGLLRGFGVDTNVTYSDTAVAVREGDNVALPGAFKWSGNAALFYENGPIKARVSAQYQSPVLFGVGGSRATDVYQDKRVTVDFAGSYDISHNLGLYFNAKNLTNEPLRFYEGSKNRPIQREYYDATVEGGVKLRF